jgi:hypothetical protein
VKQNERIVHISYNFDERIVGHEIGVDIECLATVSSEELKISNEMHNQKGAEK